MSRVIGIAALLACALLPEAARAQTEAQPAESPFTPPPPAACFPSCRSGYLCVSGACVSACNPRCGAGETCTDAGECIAHVQPSPAPSAPRIVTTTVIAPPRRSAWEDGGGTFSAGIGFGYAFVRYDAMTVRYGNVPPSTTARGSLLSVNAAFDLEHRFGAYVGLGIHLGIDRIVNSDTSSGVASRVTLGPSLTFYPSRHFFLSIGGWVVYQSFDDIPGRIRGDGTEGARLDADAELDAEAIVGIATSLRFGFPIVLSEHLSIVPEIGGWVMPTTFVLEEGSAWFDATTGGTAMTDATGALTVGATISLSSRYYF